MADQIKSARGNFAHPWQQSTGLLYVLRGGSNYFEVSVTMANGSRDIGARSDYAAKLLALMAQAAAAPAVPAVDALTVETIADVVTKLMRAGHIDWTAQEPEYEGGDDGGFNSDAEERATLCHFIRKVAPALATLSTVPDEQQKQADRDRSDAIRYRLLVDQGGVLPPVAAPVSQHGATEAILRASEVMHKALESIAEPANSHCGCSFPCRCEDEGAEAIRASWMRGEAEAALAEAENIVKSSTAGPAKGGITKPDSGNFLAHPADAGAVAEGEATSERKPLTDAAVDHTRTLVRFILENADKFEWSLQGLGMLRLHVTKEIRMHVWDLRFAFPGASPVHDHLQWGLESTVVSGRITNYRFTESPDGESYFYATIKAGYGCYFKHDPIPIQLRQGTPEIYTAGMSYRQRPNEIHCSAPDNGTITLMQKTPTEDGESARVFWRAGDEWGSAEPRPATPEEVAAITKYALAVFDGRAIERHHGIPGGGKNGA